MKQFLRKNSVDKGLRQKRHDGLLVYCSLDDICPVIGTQSSRDYGIYVIPCQDDKLDAMLTPEFKTLVGKLREIKSAGIRNVDFFYANHAGMNSPLLHGHGMAINDYLASQDVWINRWRCLNSKFEYINPVIDFHTGNKKRSSEILAEQMRCVRAQLIRAKYLLYTDKGECILREEPKYRDDRHFEDMAKHCVHIQTASGIGPLIHALDDVASFENERKHGVVRYF